MLQLTFIEGRNFLFLKTLSVLQSSLYLRDFSVDVKKQGGGGN